MNLIARLLNRYKFHKTIKADETSNVVDGIVKAKALYKKLSIAVHPDRNPGNREQAEELMEKVVANKHNYAALREIEKEVNQTLNTHK